LEYLQWVNFLLTTVYNYDKIAKSVLSLSWLRIKPAKKFQAAEWLLQGPESQRLMVIPLFILDGELMGRGVFPSASSMSVTSSLDGSPADLPS
jgi:hypothetical protein